MLCASFGWNWSSTCSSWEDDEMNEKENDYNQQKDFDQEKITWAFGSGELNRLLAHRK